MVIVAGNFILWKSARGPGGLCWIVSGWQSHCTGSHLMMISGPLASFRSDGPEFRILHPVECVVEGVARLRVPCVTQSGRRQNGVTGPRDPSKVSTTRAREFSTPNEGRVFFSGTVYFSKSLGRDCTLRSSGKPPQSSHCVSLWCHATQQ